MNGEWLDGVLSRHEENKENLIEREDQFLDGGVLINTGLMQMLRLSPLTYGKGQFMAKF